MGHEEPSGQGPGGHGDPPVPPGVDPMVPSSARMHDCLLGGRTNYAVDRRAAEDVLSVVPSAGFWPPTRPRCTGASAPRARRAAVPDPGTSHTRGLSLEHQGALLVVSQVEQVMDCRCVVGRRQEREDQGRGPFAARVVDVVGLYLDPPAGAVVLSVDEKTQVQALDRTQPLLPVSFGKTEKRTCDYKRHGTANLFAALDTGTGEVTGRCFPRHRTREFPGFMDVIAARYPSRDIHVVLDNLSAHSGTEVDKWLSRHRNFRFHFTPVGSSWLNQVEIWFGIITRQAIRRGTFGSGPPAHPDDQQLYLLMERRFRPV